MFINQRMQAVFTQYQIVSYSVANMHFFNEVKMSNFNKTITNQSMFTVTKINNNNFYLK